MKRFRTPIAVLAAALISITAFGMSAAGATVITQNGSEGGYIATGPPGTTVKFSFVHGSFVQNALTCGTTNSQVNEEISLGEGEPSAAISTLDLVAACVGGVQINSAGVCIRITSINDGLCDQTQGSQAFATAPIVGHNYTPSIQLASTPGGANVFTLKDNTTSTTQTLNANCPSGTDCSALSAGVYVTSTALGNLAKFGTIFFGDTEATGKPTGLPKVTDRLVSTTWKTLEVTLVDFEHPARVCASPSAYDGPSGDFGVEWVAKNCAN